MEEIQSGVFLCTAEEMIGDQTMWDSDCPDCENSDYFCDEDIDGHYCSAYWCNFDFSIYPFWVTTDCGMNEPEGFETEAEAMKYLD